MITHELKLRKNNISSLLLDKRLELTKLEINHLLHFVLTIVTFFLWSPIWVCLCVYILVTRTNITSDMFELTNQLCKIELKLINQQI